MRVEPVTLRTPDGRPYGIRSLRPGEAGMLLDHLWELQATDPDVHFTDPDEFGWTADRLHGQIDRLTRAPNGLYVAAIAPEGVVGSLNLVGGRHKKTAHAAQLGMGVRRAWRRQGVGRRLVETAVAAARRAEGIAVLGLDVFARNRAARRLYESLGFREEGRRGGAVRIGGVDEDVLHMTLRLS